MTEDDYIEYIQKDLLGTISDQEKNRLHAWIKESNENEEIADNLYRAWEVSDQFGVDLDIDVMSDYNIVKSKIHISEKGSTDSGKMPFLRPRIWMSIAASIAAIFAFFFLLRQPGNIEVLASADKFEVALPDGSKAILASGTKLTYKSNFEEGRIINLDGSAYLDIAHDASRPFEVHSAHIETRVLGTKFFMKDGLNEDSAEVQLIEGRVSVYHKLTDATEILMPNERVEIEADQMKKVDRLKTVDFDWYFEDLFFDEIILSDVITQLESRYGVHIVANEQLEQCSFSGNFSNQPLSEILSSIAGVFGAELEKGIDSYQILNGQCE